MSYDGILRDAMNELERAIIPEDAIEAMGINYYQDGPSSAETQEMRNQNQFIPKVTVGGGALGSATIASGSNIGTWAGNNTRNTGLVDSQNRAEINNLNEMIAMLRRENEQLKADNKSLQAQLSKPTAPMRRIEV
jgi:hypothetical protein